MSPVTFMLEGSIGEIAYQEAHGIAEVMNQYFVDEARKEVQSESNT